MIQLKIEKQVEGQCDASLVRIMLQNLLGNAWKFTSKRKEALIQFGQKPLWIKGQLFSLH
jgi:signal transduction histidine kinase